MASTIAYKDYKDSGFSNILEDEWEAYERRAVYQLAYITGISAMKIYGLFAVPPIQLCVCALADKIKEQDKAGTNKASESADGYSVSYRDQSRKQKEDELKQICLMYLDGTGLMYCGGFG